MQNKFQDMPKIKFTTKTNSGEGERSEIKEGTKKLQLSLISSYLKKSKAIIV